MRSRAGAGAIPQASVRIIGMQAIYVLKDFVIYKVKIGDGKVIDLPLPPKLTAADVKRLHAFLLTQIDDND